MEEHERIRLIEVSKRFYHRENTIQVLSGVTVSAVEGKAVALMGPSGSGKTTLLHLIAGLEAVDEGEIWVDQIPIHQIGVDEITRWRNRSIGLVYQRHLLVEELTALENVVLRCLIAGWSRARAIDRSIYWLERVGLKDRIHHYPAELSGGEAQRVAIARALVTEPSLILADEPTGNLDEVTGMHVISLLLELGRETGANLIVATHNRSISEQCDVVWYLHHGQITVESPRDVHSIIYPEEKPS